MNETKKKVLEIIASCAGVPQTEIKEEAVLMEDLGMTDVDMEELAIELETEFRTDIPDEVVKNLFIEAKDVVDYIDNI